MTRPAVCGPALQHCSRPFMWHPCLVVLNHLSAAGMAFLAGLVSRLVAPPVSPAGRPACLALTSCCCDLGLQAYLTWLQPQSGWTSWCNQALCTAAPAKRLVPLAAHHILLSALLLLRRSPPDATDIYDESELLKCMRLEDQALQSLFMEHTA